MFCMHTNAELKALLCELMLPKYHNNQLFLFYLQMGDDFVTNENKEFLEEVMKDKLKVQNEITSPLAKGDIQRAGQWTPFTRRVGLIARKIGNYPVWDKDGNKMLTTLLQV